MRYNLKKEGILTAGALLIAACFLCGPALAEEPADPFDDPFFQEASTVTSQDEVVLEQSVSEEGQPEPQDYAALGQPAQDQSFEAQNPPEDLRMEISMLNFDRDASADDLGARHELVGKIAAVSDPNLRYELLAYLESREKEGESLPL